MTDQTFAGVYRQGRVNRNLVKGEAMNQFLQVVIAINSYIMSTAIWVRIVIQALCTALRIRGRKLPLIAKLLKLCSFQLRANYWGNAGYLSTQRFAEIFGRAGEDAAFGGLVYSESRSINRHQLK